MDNLLSGYPFTGSEWSFLWLY